MEADMVIILICRDGQFPEIFEPVLSETAFKDKSAVYVTIIDPAYKQNHAVGFSECTQNILNRDDGADGKAIKCRERWRSSFLPFNLFCLIVVNGSCAACKVSVSAMTY